MSTENLWDEISDEPAEPTSTATLASPPHQHGPMDSEPELEAEPTAKQKAEAARKARDELVDRGRGWLEKLREAEGRLAEAKAAMDAARAVDWRSRKVSEFQTIGELRDALEHVNKPLELGYLHDDLRLPGERKISFSNETERLRNLLIASASPQVGNRIAELDHAISLAKRESLDCSALVAERSKFFDGQDDWRFAPQNC